MAAVNVVLAVGLTLLAFSAVLVVVVGVHPWVFRRRTRKR